MAVEFVEITGRPDLIRLARDNEYTEWGAKYTLEGYQEAAARMSKVLEDGGSKLRYWAMVDLQANKVYTSGRVLYRPAYSKETGSPGQTRTEAVLGSVFTAQDCRGQGHASVLLDKVIELVKKEVDVMTLWSDVGTFYERWGFKLVETPSERIQLPEVTCEWPAGLEPLDEQGVLDLMQLHEKVVRTAVDAAAVFKAAPISVLPDPSFAHLSLERGNVMREKHSVPLDGPIGAKTATSWAVWHPTKMGQLMIMALVGDTVDELVDLVKAALASRAGLVVIFEPGSIIGPHKDKVLAGLHAAGIQAVIAERTVALSMYASDKYQWVYPSPYFWF